MKLIKDMTVISFFSFRQCHINNEHLQNFDCLQLTSTCLELSTKPVHVYGFSHFAYYFNITFSFRVQISQFLSGQLPVVKKVIEL